MTSIAPGAQPDKYNHVVYGVLGCVVLPELACDVTQHADVAAVVMQEGLAHVCLVTPSMTLVRSKIETSIPRKRKGLCSQHDKVSLVKSKMIICCYWYVVAH